MSETKRRKPPGRRGKAAAEGSGELPLEPGTAPPPGKAPVSGGDELPAFLREGGPGREAAVDAPAAAAPSARALALLDALCARLPAGWRAQVRSGLLAAGAANPGETLLILWPGWWALWLAAGGMPELPRLLAFSLGVLLACGAGRALGGPLGASGAPPTSGRGAARVLGLVLLAPVVALLLVAGKASLALASGSVAVAALAHFGRRHAPIAALLGAALRSWPLLLAWLVTTGSLTATTGLLFVIAMLFVLIQDSEHAMCGRGSLAGAGTAPLTAVFGDACRGILGVLMATFLIALLLLGRRTGLDWIWTAGWAAAALLLARQHWLLRRQEPAAGEAAWRSNHALALLLWAAIAVALAIDPAGTA